MAYEAMSRGRSSAEARLLRSSNGANARSTTSQRAPRTEERHRGEVTRSRIAALSAADPIRQPGWRLTPERLPTPGRCPTLRSRGRDRPKTPAIGPALPERRPGGALGADARVDQARRRAARLDLS